MQEVEGSTPSGGSCPNDFSNPIDQYIGTKCALSRKWQSMIAVSLNVGSGIRLIKPAKVYMCTQTHYKHNEDGHTALGVCGRGSIPLSHSGLVGHLTRKSGILGSIPGLATFFRFSFFKKGSCQLLAKVCARSTG